MIRKISALLMVLMIALGSVSASTFVYKKEEGKVIDESSISTSVTAPVFEFESASQILIEASTGRVLYANNENEKLLPASVTKVMTLLLLMEQIDSGKLSYDDKVVCSAKAAGMGGSQIWFKENEELTIQEAIKAIAVVSANDVTVAIAEKIGGTEGNFVNMMNEKAKELGMENTHFMNSHGIDEDDHYTTAKDIAIMSRELITKHPDILNFTSIWQDSLRNGEFTLSSTNKLIRYYEGANGLKTGSTSQALFNLSASATRNGMTLISVVMKAPSSDIRLQETKQLLDFGFANYEVKKICEKEEILDAIQVNKNISDMIETQIGEEVTILTEKGLNPEIEKVISYNELVAPIREGDVIGKLLIKNLTTDEVIKEVDIIAKNSIEKSDFFAYLKKLAKMFILVN